MALVAGACGGSDDAEISSGTIPADAADSSSLGDDDFGDFGETSESDDDVDREEGSAADKDEADSSSGGEAGGEQSNTVETFATAHHPGGMSGVMHQVVATPSSTTVTATIINGRPFDTTTFGDMLLIDGDGDVLNLLEGENDRFELAEQSVTEISLRFEPMSSDVEELTFVFNENPDDEGVEESSPELRFGPVFKSGNPAPALPDAVPVDDGSGHDNGTTLRIQGIAFSETHIALGFTATSPATRSNLIGGRFGAHLVDDVGNQYQLVGPLDGDGDYQMYIDRETGVDGVLSFAGRIDPDATSLSLVMGVDGDLTGDRSTSPRFDLGPWPIDGSYASVGGAESISVGESVSHPADVDVTLSGIDFGAESMTAAISVTNGDARRININAIQAETYLLDDAGNRYPVLPPADDEYIEVERDTELTAVLTFPGTLAPNATSVELKINDTTDPEAATAETRYPMITFGPFSVTRGSASAGAVPASVPNVSEWGDVTLERSDADAVALIFAEFNGVEVPEGVMLTLPEGILFGSGSADLGDGSDAAIEKVAEVLAYYEGDSADIIGHTDADGDEGFNQTLSEERAASVAAALGSERVDLGRLSAVGRGETEPVAPNETDEGRAQNRRVEILVRTNRGLPG